MGKKGGWVSAVKKVLSPEPKEKKEKKLNKAKRKWFGKHKSQDLDTSSPEMALAAPSLNDEVKLGEIENEKSKHAFLASAMAAEAAVRVAAEVVQPTNAAWYSGKSKMEVAAMKIQAAFRGYLARRALRALRGLVRLKLMTQGQSVKRQATITLRCMQTLARLQSQVRARRIRMAEENQALHRQLQQNREKELENLRTSIGEEWDDSMQSKEQIESNLQSKLEGAVRRERALAYAHSHQQMLKNPLISASPTFIDPNNPHWGWSWLERWMATRPWENRSIVHKELNSNRASMKSTKSRATSVGEISKRHSTRDFSFDKKPSPTARKPSQPSSHQSPSTPPPKTPNSSSAAKKSKPGNSKGSGYGTDEDSRSMLSALSERYRRHSIAGSSVRDDESFASSTTSPRYMAPTESAKARSRMPSPLGLQQNRTPENALRSCARKRISFSSSPAGLSRRHSSSPLKDIIVN